MTWEISLERLRSGDVHVCVSVSGGKASGELWPEQAGCVSGLCESGA